MIWTNVSHATGFKPVDAAKDGLRLAVEGDWVVMPATRTGSSTGTQALPHTLKSWTKYAISAPVPVGMRPVASARGPVSATIIRGSATVTAYIELEPDGILYLTPHASVQIYDIQHICVPEMRWLAA